MARQVFAARLSTDEDDQLALIRSQFDALSRLRAFDLQSLGIDSDELFSSLVQACDVALGRAADLSISLQDSALARYFGEQLQAVRRLQPLLMGFDAPDLRAILAFEQTYRAQVRSRNRFIVPPDFDSSRSVAISELYVSPTLLFSDPSDTPRAETLDTFVRSLNRSIVLASPGGGKSTLARKLAFDLAGEPSPYDRHLTPILVVLREYGVPSNLDSTSVLEFVAQRCVADLQIPVPPHALEYLCLANRVACIFDGLDELVDVSLRKRVVENLESFTSLFPAVPILVTSRETGYGFAPLSEDLFALARLREFSDAQIAEYAEKWFSHETELLPEERKTRAERFVDQSRAAPDLRANPLLLALMCCIARRDQYIPRNRPEVFERCSTLLFETWDRQRGIAPDLPFESAAHLRELLKEIAFHLYTETSGGTGVSREELVEMARAYLEEWLFPVGVEARAAARQFVDFCRGRAWVVAEVGTGSGHEALYDFVHRSFCEYFMAEYLVSSERTPAKLARRITSKVARGEWEVPAQLAIQIQNNVIKGAGHEILGIMRDSALASSGELRQERLLGFTVRCLRFLIPKPELSRQVSYNAVHLALASCSKGDRDAPGVRRARAARLHVLFGDLAAVHSSNVRYAAEGVRQALAEALANGSGFENAALEVYVLLWRDAGARSTEWSFQDGAAALLDVIQELREAAGGAASRLFQTSELGPWAAVVLGSRSTRALLNDHGGDGLFKEAVSRVGAGARFPSLARLFTQEYVGDLRDAWASVLTTASWREQRLAELGDWVRGSGWITCWGEPSSEVWKIAEGLQVRTGDDPGREVAGRQKYYETLPSQVKFGLVALWLGVVDYVGQINVSGPGRWEDEVGPVEALVRFRHTNVEWGASESGDEDEEWELDELDWSPLTGLALDDSDGSRVGEWVMGRWPFVVVRDAEEGFYGGEEEESPWSD